MEHDYDEYYDTKVSRPYARSKLGFALGSLIAFVGFCDIIITILDLYITQFNFGSAQPVSNFVMTWDENPFWPSYGKGFWVGIILIVTGIAGIVSFCEHTITSIYAFAVLNTTSAIFSFYLLITSTIPVSRYSEVGTGNLQNIFLNSLALNSCLLGLGAIGFILCSVAGVLSCLLVGCFAERRGYGGQFVENFYKSIPANTPLRTNPPPAIREMGFLNF